MLSFFKKPLVIALGLGLIAAAGYSFLKNKNPGGYFSWLP